MARPDDLVVTGYQDGPSWYQQRPAQASWADIEGSGLTGVAALEAVIAGLDRMPLLVSLEVRRLPARVSPDVPWPAHAGQLIITYRAPDAYNPAQPRKQQFMTMIPAEPPGLPPEDRPGPREWAAWLLHVLAYLACHEVAEFFVVGGVRVFDPHAKGARPVVHLPSHPVMLRGWR